MAGPCPSCESPNPSEHGAKGSLHLVRCRRCGLVYSDPMPRAEVERRYLSEYDLGEHFRTWTDRKRILFARRLAELPDPAPGRDRLCDVGCADGQFLELAAERGWRVEGVELNPPAAAAARAKGFVVHEGAVERLHRLDWGEFGLVTAWDVLEHTPDPRPFAAALARLAAPGGTVALTTLNRRSLAARVFGMRWSMIGEDHFTYWDRRSLQGLLVQAGLSAQRITSFGVGRDFFRWADVVQGRLRGNDRRPSGSTHRAGHSGSASWDTSSVVIAAERAANRTLGAFGAGLELCALAGRPA